MTLPDIKSIFMGSEKENLIIPQEKFRCGLSEMPVCQCNVTDGIFIRFKEGYHKKYMFNNILWVEASGNYCYIHLKNDSEEVLVLQLSIIEKVLPIDLFKRIHRSYIVNMYAVDGFVGNQLCIGDNRLPVSEPYRRSILHCFTILDADKVHLRSRRKKMEKGIS